MNQNNKYHTWHRIQNGTVTISQFSTTNEDQEVSPFPAGDHKTAMSRRESTEITQMIHQKVLPWKGQ